ncbi:DoxX family protein [Paenibacillus qinlingensis]|uniref:Membrane protein YphA (DoxX/SURF4 family) n=1 Tax=Paenibacillus qinlingensis TaxID=1837343 RepID=A0ABU1NY13_9BACL|nr:DoxX family protein [Paenibacillus qinlingensis]MDR6552402.1 putative membrane protein YphA (DoxX/SURF4 family) [Paenibacillus qinlingensis]
MHITIWIIQGLAAFGFVYSGWLKAFQYDKASASWGWVKDVPKAFVVFIGLAELIGAVGLILPQATNIAPVWTPIAATALAAVVLLGALFHIARKEYRDIGVNVIFFALALLVAIGRF